MPEPRYVVRMIQGVDPVQCCGFRNVFINCGINTIKHYNINTGQKIDDCFNRFKVKIDQVMKLCPQAKIVVSPILPTKRKDWNNRGMHCNRRLFDYRRETQDRFTTLGFGVFRDPATGFLRDDLGSYWNRDDVLHLGSRGISILVAQIRDNVFSNKVVSTKSWADVLRDGSAFGTGGRGATQAGSSGVKS